MGHCSYRNFQGKSAKNWPSGHQNLKTMYDFSHPEFLYKVQIIWDIFLIHSSVWQKKLANRAAFGSWGPKNVMVFVDALLCSYQGFYIINQGHIGYSSHLINQKCQKSVTHKLKFSIVSYNCRLSSQLVLSENHTSNIYAIQKLKI